MNHPELSQQANFDHLQAKSRSPGASISIRQRLEKDASGNCPSFVHRHGFSQQEPIQNHTRPEPRLPVVKNSRRSWLVWQDRALLLIWIVLTTLLLLRISTAEAQPDETGAIDEIQWGVEFQSGQEKLHSLALSTEIDADITGMIARIDVRQRFRNNSSGWAEALYRFPLPPGAAVDRLLVKTKDRVLEGEIQEKKTAQRQYQKAKADGKVTALVEQQRPNQFETKLANIGPGEEIMISISFLTHVDFRDSSFSLQIPLTFTPRWLGQDMGETGTSPSVTALNPTDNTDEHYLSVDIRLRSGISLASVESRYHDITITPVQDGYDLFLANPDTRMDRVFELNWTPDFGHQPEASLMTWDDGESVFAMLMLAPPLLEALKPQAREVIFIIDTSGSMEGLSLQQAKAALHQGLKRLGPQDQFNLIHFNSDSHMLFEKSVPVDHSGMLTALDFIDELMANGGTNMAPALHDAMSLPRKNGLLRQIVFITDGSVGNEEELLLQLANQLGESRLFTVAIGSAPNSGFMRKAAEIGRGNHTHIGRLDEVTERMNTLWTRIENPALQNICVDWGMNAETFPEIIPDLYAGEPLWLFSRLPAQPSEVTLCGELNGQNWETTSRPLAESGNENLASLWARSKIEALQDSRLFGFDAELMQLEITALALDFGLITPYTSLVAIDRTPARPAGENLQSGGVGNLLPAGSSLSVVGFSQTATAWQIQALLSFIALLAATGLLLFCTPPTQKRADGTLLPSNQGLVES